MMRIVPPSTLIDVTVIGIDGGDCCSCATTDVTVENAMAAPRKTRAALDFVNERIDLSSSVHG
jgi:hypothetical protein